MLFEPNDAPPMWGGGVIATGGGGVQGGVQVFIQILMRILMLIFVLILMLIVFGSSMLILKVLNEYHSVPESPLPDIVLYVTSTRG